MDGGHLPSPQGETTAAAQPLYRRLLPGDRIPSLVQACGERPRFVFDTLAGRYHLLGFFMACDTDQVLADLQAVAARRRDIFNDSRCTFTGVTVTRAERSRGLRSLEPGFRIAWDFDHAMSRLCGAAPVDSQPDEPTPVRRQWILVDPSLHILRIFPMTQTRAEEVIAFIESLPEPDRFGGVHRPAPILMLPNVFEPELCRRLVDLYETHGGEESGVHRMGQPVMDSGFKRRRDLTLTAPDLLDTLRGRIARRVLPEIERVFFMHANYIERHIVGCYAAEDGGHFAPHVDNNGVLTGHRRFAVSINLSGDFDGGEVVFPEYSRQGYRAPPGWAVVFPCGVLHAVNRVTRGVRYAYLPFVYDEAGQRIREAALAAHPPG